MPYEPALDGLRGFAVVLVMLFHAHAPIALGGFIGVDLFFVLSGFLITSLLLAELDLRGRIDVPRFYLRRFLRLTPALVLMLATYVAVANFLWPGTTGHLMQAALAAGYLSDYAVAFRGIPDLLSHTWSLSVEEHFYLLWPFALLLACRRWDCQSLPAALAAGYLIATALRWFFVVRGQSWEQVYYRFDTRLSGLLLGACLGALRRDTLRFAKLQRGAPALLWLALVGGTLCLQSRWGEPWMLTWGVTAAEWCALALIVAALVPQGQVAAMLSIPPLVHLGRLSYGVYLWHYPVFRYLRADHHWSDVLLIGAPLSIAFAAISYYAVESWFTRKNERSFRFVSSRLT